MRRNLIAWAGYFAFVALAVALSWHDGITRFEGAMGVGKGAVWLAWLLFTAYSFHCSLHENIFKSLGRMAQLYWGRQVGIDLYLGVTLFLCVVYLHAGALVFFLWLVPTLLFANLATLLFVAIHFEALVTRLWPAAALL